MHRIRGLSSAVALLIAEAAWTPQQGPVLARVRVDSVRPATFAVYSSGGRFASGDGVPRLRQDTVSLSTPAVLTVDVAGGGVHFVAGAASAQIRVDAVPLQSGPALWLEAEGAHVLLDQGGSSIRTLPR